MFVIILIVLFCVYQAFHYFKWKSVEPNFSGKTILITGASSGIGECLALEFTTAGAKKLILAARRITELERVKSAC